MERGSRRVSEKDVRKQRYRENSKKEMIEEVQRRMRTMMIGNLASIEDYYDGVIRKDPELWAELRQEILDKGNDQIRAVIEKLEGYDVDRVGYKTYFNVRQNNG